MQAPRSIINKVDRQQESGKLCDGPDSHAGVIQLEQAVEIEGLPWLAERSGNYRGGGWGNCTYRQIEIHDWNQVECRFLPG